jgi:CheY-like chemotaxis protein
MRAKPKVLVVETAPISGVCSDRAESARLSGEARRQWCRAVDRIASERPDVILMDWVMPLMDGEEMLDKLAGNGDAEVPIIVISGYQPPEAQPLDRRIRRWLTKPVTIEELVTEIESPLVPR